MWQSFAVWNRYFIQRTVFTRVRVGQRVRGRQDNLEHNPPLIIRDEVMNNFINLTQWTLWPSLTWLHTEKDEKIRQTFGGIIFLLYFCRKNKLKKGKTIMQSTANIENISISIPITDLSFLRTLSKKRGWTIKRQRKSGIDRALDDIKAGRVYEARSVDDLFEQLEKWNTGSNTPAHSKSHINYVSVEATIWLNWRKPSQFLNVKASCPPDTDLIYFPADMQENGSVTLNPTGFLFGFRKTTRWHFSSLIQELIQTYFENHRITWTGSSPRKSEPMYLSLWPRELLTIVESHILRVSEIQLRYKSPSFSQFSSNRQSLKMTSYCQPDLANGRMV